MDPLAWIGVFLAVGALFGTDEKPEEVKLTPQREHLFKMLMRGRYAPKDLREAADKFEQVGCKVQAQYLRKRAASRELPPEAQAARKEVLRKVFACTDIPTILEFADVCEKEGMINIAKNARQRAEALKNLPAVQLPPKASP